MIRFIQFFQDLIVIKKNHNLVVTNMHFGTIPVRLFQPKAVSSEGRRGIIFYHGGGAICGSLGEYFLCWVGERGLHDRQSLSNILMRTSLGGVKANRSWNF